MLTTCLKKDKVEEGEEEEEEEEEEGCGGDLSNSSMRQLVNTMLTEVFKKATSGW